jgi:hypothetical protein
MIGIPLRRVFFLKRPEVIAAVHYIITGWRSEPERQLSVNSIGERRRTDSRRGAV